MTARDLPSEIETATSVWYWGHVSWLVGGFILGILGIFLPAVIASGLITDQTTTKMVALAAATISGLQAYLKCEVRADRLHVAWRYIQTAKLRFLHETDYAVEQLISEYDKGEQVIESAYTPVATEPHTQAD